MSEYQPLAIVTTWERFNDDLIRLVDYVPDDQINWSPKPELWNFKGILLHIADARDNWMTGAAEVAGAPEQSVWHTAKTKDDIKDAYRRTWARLADFLSNSKRLDHVYYDPEDGEFTGHWMAFHLLEHDIHHRANIFDYLAMLGIETPDVGTP